MTYDRLLAAYTRLQRKSKGLLSIFWRISRIVLKTLSLKLYKKHSPERKNRIRKLMKIIH